ncbi:DNA primase [Spiroplasma apis]|uniref:DNA primase n=1 Tax=Spiroplasma apis B31 TaxID=1276258 RepID=V5RJA3_SPIAP|nr:DNA primase [Spiroplasma apis]AHB36538.1 DNA primase [Spiroplasma apis B31]
MKISQQQIDNIIQLTDISEVIGKYLDLQKKGRDYRAVCPFHDDSSPSLMISKEKKIFKCFVCGTGGNAITFLQEFNNISFYKALSLLAKDSNIVIEGLNNLEDKPKVSSFESRLFDLNKEAAKFFNGLLLTSEAKKARNYLTNRNISSQEIEKFKIGYCPGNSNLYSFLKGKGFTKKEIEISGLIYTQGVNQVPFFKDRIIFPITDIDSNIIGFSGRVVDPNDTPKYKNSSENNVFKKSQLAYNLENAKKEIRIKNEILILEGFMDVISLERINIKNSIAIMGTTFSNFHLDLITKVTKNIKLFLDGDKPGVMAALKIAKFLMSKRLNVTIIQNDTSKDPDELVTAGEVNLINQMIANSKHPVDFAIDYFVKETDLNDTLQVDNFIKNVIDVLQYEKNEIISAKNINKISELTNIDKSLIEKTLAKTTPNIFVKEEKPKTEFIPPYIIGNETQDNGFFIPNYDLQEKTLNLVTKKSFDNNLNKRDFNRIKSAKNKAESAIILELLRSDENAKVIEKKLNLFESSSLRTIAKFIIEQYRENKYNGNDFEIIANAASQISRKFQEILYNINNLNFAWVQNRLSEKAIEDIFDTIEIYRLKLEEENYINKLKSTNNYQLKKDLMLQIDNIRKQIQVVEKKRGN